MYGLSIVGTRRQCAKELRKFNEDKSFGPLENVIFKRIGFMTWYLFFEAEARPHDPR